MKERERERERGKKKQSKRMYWSVTNVGPCRRSCAIFLDYFVWFASDKSERRVYFSNETFESFSRLLCILKPCVSYDETFQFLKLAGLDLLLNSQLVRKIRRMEIRLILELNAASPIQFT